MSKILVRVEFRSPFLGHFEVLRKEVDLSTIGQLLADFVIFAIPASLVNLFHQLPEDIMRLVDPLKLDHCPQHCILGI